VLDAPRQSNRHLRLRQVRLIVLPLAPHVLIEVNEVSSPLLVRKATSISNVSPGLRRSPIGWARRWRSAHALTAMQER
jgi:hypothetical protein